MSARPKKDLLTLTTERLKYPAVPAPRNEPQAIFRTVNALYQAYHALVGVPNETELTVISKGTLPTEEVVESSYPVAINSPKALDGMVYDLTSAAWVNSDVVTMMAAGCTISAAPSVSDSFNVASCAKISTGLYRCTLSTSQYLGEYLLDKIVPNILLSPGETDASSEIIYKSCAFVGVSSVAGTFDIQIYKPEVDTSGTNAWITAAPCDLAGGDSVAVSLLIVRDGDIDG
jgi:hypothetical protein